MDVVYCVMESVGGTPILARIFATKEDAKSYANARGSEYVVHVWEVE